MKLYWINQTYLKIKNFLRFIYYIFILCILNQLRIATEINNDFFFFIRGTNIQFRISQGAYPLIWFIEGICPLCPTNGHAFDRATFRPCSLKLPYNLNELVIYFSWMKNRNIYLLCNSDLLTDDRKKLHSKCRNMFIYFM